MPYTETQRRAGKTYYYRTRSIRREGKVSKKRVYLGTNLSKGERARREREADRALGDLNALLTRADVAFLAREKTAFKKEPRSTWENRYEAFLSLFTYDSNAIEGNTLTLEETSHLLFEGLVPKRSLREINESLNHKKAFDFLLSYRGDLSKRFICQLHDMVVQETLRSDLASQVGRYRTVQVYIRGVEWTPPGPKAVPKDMKVLLEWYTKNKAKVHPVVAAAYFHVGFEIVHPFVDGNGRVGRLLMNFILYKNGYPMIDIPYRRRRDYYGALQKAHVNGDLRPFLERILKNYGESQLRF